MLGRQVFLAIFPHFVHLYRIVQSTLKDFNLAFTSNTNEGERVIVCCERADV